MKNARAWRAWPLAPILALALGLQGAGITGCGRLLPEDLSMPSSLSFPWEEPPAQVSPPPGVNPGDTATAYTWAELSARGRGALTAGEYAAAERAFLSALAQSDAFPAHDIRVETSLLNLTYLAQAEERAGLHADSLALVEELISRERVDRRVDFDVAAPVMLIQAERLGSAGDTAGAARIAQAALRLKGASDPMNAQLRRQVEEIMWPVVPEAAAE